MSVRTMGRALAAVAALAFAVVFVPTASFADQPKTPQPVADYFAQGLVPRLIDLYGSGNGVTKGIDFDATTKVGGISRVREWTPDFLAGKPSDDPTRLTNNWIAPVSLRGEVIGLATVWINPADDQPELASFDPAALAQQLAAAPATSSLVHDPNREAWFALTADALIPLVSGESGVSEATTPAAYQRLVSGTVLPPVASGPSGVSIAALVLGVVIVGLAVFVLLPVKKKTPPKPANDNADDNADGNAHGAHVGATTDDVLIVTPDAPETKPAHNAEVAAPPATQVAAQKSPIRKTPTTKSPTTKSATTNTPAAKSPATKSVTTNTPAAKSPATKSVTTNTPATKSPATKTQTTKTQTTGAPQGRPTGKKPPASKAKTGEGLSE